MIINPKILSLKPEAISLNGFFISAVTYKSTSLDNETRTELLLKALYGIRAFHSYDFEILACKGIYKGHTEDSFFVKDNSGNFNLKLANDVMNLGELFGQSNVLFTAKDTGADLVKLGGFRGDFDSLELVKNDVVHQSDVDLDSKDDCSVIDLGGGWVQIVQYK